MRKRLRRIVNDARQYEQDYRQAGQQMRFDIADLVPESDFLTRESGIEDTNGGLRRIKPRL